MLTGQLKSSQAGFEICCGITLSDSSEGTQHIENQNAYSTHALTHTECSQNGVPLCVLQTHNHMGKMIYFTC